ncbi:MULTISPECIES: Hvo_1808 family surface protein [Salinibaculum]|uniref:Hvo_1808 family surface protein n=1 Tax=Salinibaculum TaxID=2732368 RepID=UPI0030CE7484
MRRLLLLAALVVLAGCATPFAASDDNSTAAGTPTPVTHDERPDPDSDRLGWENGLWHDDPVAVDPADGLNESERAQVINRAMARVEVVRNLEFDREVNVSVISRDEFDAGSAGGGGETGEALRRFDNAKFEALHLIGKETDSIAEQDDTRNRTIGGFYSPARGNIVIVSESDSPQFDGERTLAHELVHALQDQEFDLSRDRPTSRDAYNGRNGLVEGDAGAVEDAYLDRCGDTWSCLPRENTSTGAGGNASAAPFNLGVYILEFFPYSDGPGFVRALADGDDWSAVNDAFENPPSSAVEVIYPDRYGSFEPRDVQLRDRNSGGWERVRPESRPDHGVLGQSGLTAMFAYTLYDDYEPRGVVAPQEFLNLNANGTVDRSDPFDYALPAVDGWTGDRFHAYARGDERAYVWRLTWESSAEASEFAESYRRLVGHWGGEAVGDGVWRVADDSPFAGAVDVTVDGDTVTIVGAPSRSALGDVYRGAG